MVKADQYNGIMPLTTEVRDIYYLWLGNDLQGKSKSSCFLFYSIMMVQPAIIVIIHRIVPLLSPEHP